MIEFCLGMFLGGVFGFLACALLMFDDWKGER